MTTIPDRCSVLDMVRVEVRAFGRARRMAAWERASFAALSAMALWAYERRAATGGRAVCLLGLRPWRAGLAIAALVVTTAVTAALAPAVAACAAAVVVLLLLPSAGRAVRGAPAAVRLRRASPPGPGVYLHSLASREPGAGAELLWSVIEEADARGWSLLLDAGSERLVSYYERFGFRAYSGVVAGSRGGRVRMWRPGRA